MKTKRDIEYNLLKKLYKEIASKYNESNISVLVPERNIVETIIQAYIKERE